MYYKLIKCELILGVFSAVLCKNFGGTRYAQRYSISRVYLLEGSLLLDVKKFNKTMS